MIKEHDRIVLTEPGPAEGLEVGDVGTVVHVYADGKAFEVEFTTLDAWKELRTSGFARYPFGRTEIEAVAEASRLLEKAAGVTRNDVERTAFYRR
jgi:hypothetical protein